MAEVRKQGLMEIRKARGLTRREVSERSGINFRSLQDYEQGHKSITSAKGETLYRLSLVLGCTVEELLDGELLDTRGARKEPLAAGSAESEWEALLFSDSAEPEGEELSEECSAEPEREALPDGHGAEPEEEDLPAEHSAEPVEEELSAEHGAEPEEEDLPEEHSAEPEEEERSVTDSVEPEEEELSDGHGAEPDGEEQTRADIRRERLAARKAEIERAEIYSRKHRLYGRWKVRGDKCMIVFLYEGQLVQLPFEEEFKRNRFRRLAGHAARQMDAYIAKAERDKEES